MQQGNRIGLAAMLVCVFTPGLLADTITVFNFNILELTGTPFTDTAGNGLEASFSGSDDSNNPFVVVDSMGLLKTLTGNVLAGSYFGPVPIHQVPDRTVM